MQKYFAICIKYGIFAAQNRINIQNERKEQPYRNSQDAYFEQGIRQSGRGVASIETGRIHIDSSHVEQRSQATESGKSSEHER